MKSEFPFEEDYWLENYAQPESMDGMGNASDHARYMKSLFDLDLIDISTVVDFGFGMGKLFEAVLSEFLPYRAMGIEPSRFAYKKVVDRNIAPVSSMKLKLHNWDLSTWAQKQKPGSKIFDLGLCTSVLQYLSDDQLKEVLPIMANKVKYLYLTVPTNKELDRQVEELEFKDRYALRRSRTRYWSLLRPHFTCVGSRMLESKVHFNQENTLFTEQLYRF